jgi:hypothetical protein
VNIQINCDQIRKQQLFTVAETLTRDSIIYRKIINNKGMEKLQTDLNRLGEWAVENAMVINPAKSKAVCFMRS